MLAVLAVAALAFAGCSRSKDSAAKFTGERRPVAQAIEDLQKAGQRGDAKKICRDLLSASVEKRVASGGKDCQSVLKRQLSDADTFELTVVSVSLDGGKNGAAATHATARVKSTDNGKDRFDLFTLVRETGRWRIQSLGGV
ncbi:MAG: hypothetical protein QOI98_1790 [Solirubrobacteraceae bacterium]|jgi:hypothetical protein|nr:hypothetical protein [Solirubrobacteraceae bacterium]